MRRIDSMPSIWSWWRNREATTRLSGTSKRSVMSDGVGVCDGVWVCVMMVCGCV